MHVHGRLRIIDDEKFVRGVVARLTRRHEAAHPQPWKMGDALADYLDGMCLLGCQLVHANPISQPRRSGKAC